MELEMRLITLDGRHKLKKTHNFKYAVVFGEETEPRHFYIESAKIRDDLRSTFPAMNYPFFLDDRGNDADFYEGYGAKRKGSRNKLYYIYIKGDEQLMLARLAGIIN